MHCFVICVHAQWLSCVHLLWPWTVAHQAPLSMGFFRQGSWSGLPFPSLGDPSKPGIEPRSPKLQADSLPTELWGKNYHTIQQLPFWVLIWKNWNQDLKQTSARPCFLQLYSRWPRCGHNPRAHQSTDEWIKNMCLYMQWNTIFPLKRRTCCSGRENGWTSRTLC